MARKYVNYMLVETYKGNSGVEYIFEYHDADSFENLELSLCRQAYGVCFDGDKMVIVFNGKKNIWGLVGGTVEEGETLEQTLQREIREESNMEVISFLPIGYQKMIDTRDRSFVYQLRYVCNVCPYGPFVEDPADSVTKITAIDPSEYKRYFDWGSIGEHIIKRAVELKKNL